MLTRSTLPARRSSWPVWTRMPGLLVSVLFNGRIWPFDDQVQQIQHGQFDGMDFVGRPAASFFQLVKKLGHLVNNVVRLIAAGEAVVNRTINSLFDECCHNFSAIERPDTRARMSD